MPPNGYEMPFGPLPFAPSTTGQLISHSDFIPARRCAKCHTATHLEWNQSAHRNAFREPFYQANVNHLIRERGIVATRHCESCHNPVALFSGARSINSKLDRPFDEEGVSCSVCHSIQSVTTQGIGSYVIAPPALLELKDGRRIKDATDQQILVDLESHSRAVMRPLLQQPEFCATCHKSAIVPELNGRKWFRTFSVYDEWQQSAFAGETVQPLSVRPRQGCQSCHMPRQENTGYASHRWPGGNTAIPAHYGWTQQVKATADLLKAANVAVDIFALHSAAGSQSESFAPLDNSSSIVPGQTVSVDVVVANRGVGHTFPAELRDMFEAWLEFQATDVNGKVLIHSGAVSLDGMLEWDAHAYRAVPTITVNGVAAAIQGNNFTASVPVAEGPNTLLLVATDAAGNHTDVTRHVVRDTTPPTMAIQQPADNSVTNSSQVTVSGTFNDATTTTVKVNNVNATLTGNTFSATVPLVEGVNGLNVVAIDAAGNQNAVARNIVRDTTAPSIAITQPSNGAFIKNREVTVTGTFSDATATTITVNNIAATVSGSNFTVSVSLKQGSNTLLVAAVDASGNRTEVTQTVFSDMFAPDIEIEQPADDVVISTPQFAVTGTVEDDLPFTVTVNGVPATVASGRFTATIPLSKGRNTITVRGVDAAGNQGKTTRSVNITPTPPRPN
jgi:hypothetical protein